MSLQNGRTSRGLLRERKDNTFIDRHVQILGVMYRDSFSGPPFRDVLEGAGTRVAPTALTLPGLYCLVRRVQLSKHLNKRVMQVVRNIPVIFDQIRLRLRVFCQVVELPSAN